MSKNISYTIVDDYDKVFDEKGNTFLAMRKIAWGDNPDLEKAKLDIRKWFINADGEETPGKGTAFLTEDGPDSLTKILLEEGYGHTKEILNSIKDRDDFRKELNDIVGKNDTLYDDNVKDEFHKPSDSMFDYDE